MGRIVIGITGPIGSGVSTTAKTLEGKGFTLLKISEAIKAEARSRNIQSPTRKDMQDIGNELRKSDYFVWIKRTLSAANIIDANGRIDSWSNNLVIESIRNPHEVRFLRTLFGHSFFLIATLASKDTRWRRLSSDYSGNQNQFYDDDRRDTDEDAEYGQQVDNCANLADYASVNEIDHPTPTIQMDKIWVNLKTDVKLMESVNETTVSDGLRDAHAAEVAMAVAYAQSRQSACLKRHVGAAIVDTNGLIISVGYNENPISVRSCKVENYCYKDEEMHKALASRANVKCPLCGTAHGQLESPWKCLNCGENLKLYFFPSRNMELCTAIHAEERAIRSLGGRSADDCTIYTTTFPCFQCSRYIVDARIKRVVYVEPYPVAQAIDFLRKNNVTLEPFNGFKARAFNLVFR